jgi:hypothetical protein
VFRKGPRDLASGADSRGWFTSHTRARDAIRMVGMLKQALLYHLVVLLRLGDFYLREEVDGY